MSETNENKGAVINSPAEAFAYIAALLAAQNEKGLDEFMDQLTIGHLQSMGQFTDAIRALILDSLARLELKGEVIVTSKELPQ